MDGSSEHHDGKPLLMVGRRVVSAGRVFYQRGDEWDRSAGALQLTFDDATSVLLDGAGDGESLRVTCAPWVDPLLSMSAENESFVAEHGKWSFVDCSGEPPYDRLIGRRVEAVALMSNRFGTIAGLHASIGETSLWFIVDRDECFLSWAHPLGFRTLE